MVTSVAVNNLLIVLGCLVTARSADEVDSLRLSVNLRVKIEESTDNAESLDNVVAPSERLLYKTS